MHVAVGSTGQVMNCLGILSSIPGIKVNRRVPEKLSRIVTTWNKFNLTSFVREQGASQNAWEALILGRRTQEAAHQTTCMRLKHTLTDELLEITGLQPFPQGLGKGYTCLQSRSGQLWVCPLPWLSPNCWSPQGLLKLRASRSALPHLQMWMANKWQFLSPKDMNSF